MEGFGRHSYKDLTWHSKNVNSIKWNVNGSFISTLSSEKFVRIGQLDNNGGITVVQNIPTTIQMMQVCWHPTETNKLAICSDEKPVEFWDVRAPKAATKLTSLGGNINMAWSPSGNYVAVGNKSDYLSVYDVRTATMVKKRKMRFEVRDLIQA